MDTETISTVTMDACILWCDEQVKNGKELKIEWEGGHDEGNIFLLIDDVQTDDAPEIEEILNKFAKVLDNGTWAGEFNSSGEAVYSTETKSFSGTDYTYVNEMINTKVKIDISLPEDLWFDQLIVTLNYCAYDSNDKEVNAQFDINNGFVSNRHLATIDSLNVSLEKQVERILENGNYGDKEQRQLELRYLNDIIEIPRSSFIEKDGMLTYRIESVQMEYEVDSERDINCTLTA